MAAREGDAPYVPSPSSYQSSSSPANTPADQKPVTDQIQQLLDKYDPANPNCVFKHYFYNKVDESNIPFYKPLPHENPREWEEALEKKPAPGFIPVLCAGFTGLADRLKTQKRAVADLNTRLHQINGGLDAILSRHDLQTSVRAAAARRRHTVLQERCIGLAAKVQVLRNRGYALSGDEDDLRVRLKGLEASIQDPALGAREEELWSRLIVVRGYAERLTQEVNRPAAAGEEQMDEETELKAKKVGFSPFFLFFFFFFACGHGPAVCVLLASINVAIRFLRITRSSSCISRRRWSPSGRTLSSGRRTGARRREGISRCRCRYNMVFLAAGRTGRKYIMCESTAAGGVLMS